MDPEASPSRKRQRVEAEPEEVPRPAELPSHDPVYYKDDGDCVILVKNTLFKESRVFDHIASSSWRTDYILITQIHRFLLTRDSTVFADMFSLPGNEGLTQGTADSTPIILHDELDDFRAMCWAIYALPTELSIQSTAGGADVQKILKLTRTFNKYQFASFEKWALGILTQQCQDHKYHASCPTPDLHSLLILASECGHEPLRQTVEEMWLSRLEAENSPLEQTSLTTAAFYGSRDFLGMMYYIFLQAADKAEIVPARRTSALIHPLPKFNAAHNQKLSTGYWSLSKYWERCCKGPVVAPPRSANCQKEKHRKHCTPAWDDIWRLSLRRSDVSECRKVDVLANLGKMQNIVSKLRIANSNMDPACVVLAMGIIPSLQEELRRTMADHFLGPV